MAQPDDGTGFDLNYKTNAGDYAKDASAGLSIGIYNGMASMANFATLGAAGLEDNAKPRGGYQTWAGDLASVVGSVAVSAPVAELAVANVAAKLTKLQRISRLSYAIEGNTPSLLTRAAGAALDSTAVRVAATGAATDAIGFSSDQARLSDMLVKIDSPVVNNLVTQYLAHGDHDGFLEGRIKNALEGQGIGMAVGGLFKALKGTYNGLKGLGQGATAAVPEATAKATALRAEADKAAKAALKAQPKVEVKVGDQVVQATETDLKDLTAVADEVAKVDPEAAAKIREVVQGPSAPAPAEAASALPPTLGGKPRYKDTKLNFESEADKVIYMVTKKGGSSNQKTPERIAWLKSQGLDESQIAQRGEQIREGLKAAEKAGTLDGTVRAQQEVRKGSPEIPTGPEGVQANPDIIKPEVFRTISPQHADFENNVLEYSGFSKPQKAAMRILFAQSDMQAWKDVQFMPSDKYILPVGVSGDYGVSEGTGIASIRLLVKRGGNQHIVLVHEMYHHILTTAPVEVKQQVKELWQTLYDSGKAGEWAIQNISNTQKAVDTSMFHYFAESPEEFFAQYASEYLLRSKVGATTPPKGKVLAVVRYIQNKLLSWVENARQFVYGSDQESFEAFREFEKIIDDLGGFNKNKPVAAITPEDSYARNLAGEAENKQVFGGYSEKMRDVTKKIRADRAAKKAAAEDKALSAFIRDIETFGKQSPDIPVGPSQPELNLKDIIENVRALKDDKEAMEQLKKGNYQFFNYQRNQFSEDTQAVVAAANMGVAKTVQPLEAERLAGKLRGAGQDPEALLQAGKAEAIKREGITTAVNDAFAKVAQQAESAFYNYGRMVATGDKELGDAALGVLARSWGSLTEAFAARSRIVAQQARELRAHGGDRDYTAILPANLKPVQERISVLKEALGEGAGSGMGPGLGAGPGPGAGTGKALTAEEAQQATEVVAKVSEAKDAAAIKAVVEDSKLPEPVRIEVQNQLRQEIKAGEEKLVAAVPETGVKMEQSILNALKDMPPEVALLTKKVLENSGKPPKETLESLAKMAAAARDNPAFVEKLFKAAVENAKGQNPTAFQKYLEFWMNSVLSGPRTLVTNLLNNTVVTALAPLEVAAGGNLKEAAAMTGALFRQFHDILTAGHATERYASVMGAVKEAFQTEKPILDATAGVIEHQAGAIKGGIGRKVRLPFRILGATDEFFKQVNFRAFLTYRLTKQGHDLIATGKLEASKLGEWVDNEMANHFSVSGAVARDADGVAFGKYAKDGVDWAERNTFTQPLDKSDDWIGAIGETLMNAANTTPAIRLVLPFVKTPTNVIRKAAYMTPGINMTLKSYRNRLASADPLIRAQARGEMVLGTAFMGLGTLAAASGLITGSGPIDPKERKVLMESGWKPYAVRVSDGEGGHTYVQYNKFDPYATLFGLVADSVDTYNRAAAMQNETAMRKVEELRNGMWAAVSQNLTNKTTLIGLKDFLDAISAPTTNKVSYFINSRVGSHVPAFIAATPVTDDLGEVRSALDAIAARLPGSPGVAPRYDTFGNKITVPAVSKISPVGLGFQNMSPGEAEIVRLGYGLSAPPKKWQGVDLESITNKDGVNAYDRFQELHGQVKSNGKTMKDAMDEIASGESYQRLPMPTGVNDFENPRVRTTTKVIGAYRRAALGQLMKEFPQIMEERRRLFDTATARAGQRNQAQIANPREALGALQ